jgi:hypothetical protein
MEGADSRRHQRLHAEARKGDAEVRRGKHPITTTTAQRPRNNSFEFERPMLRKPLAFHRAASARSAIKMI